MKNSIARRITQTLKYSWQADRRVFLALAAGSALLCCGQVLEIYALNGFFAAVTAMPGAAYPVFVNAFAFVAALLLVNPLLELLEYLAQGYFWRRGNGYMQYLLHRKAAELETAEFDEPRTLDALQKAVAGNTDAPSAARTVLHFICYYLPFLICVSIFLVQRQPLLLLAILFIAGSAMAAQTLHITVIRKLQDSTAAIKRRSDYFEKCLTAREYFKETRLLGAFGLFFRLYRAAALEYGREFTAARRKILRIELGLCLAGIAGYSVTILLLVYFLCNGALTIGEFATVFYSIEKVNAVLKRMIEEVGEIVQGIAGTTFLLDFLAQPDKRQLCRPLPKNCAIRFDNVSYFYPGNSSAALRGVNFTIRPGETLAIVGENGAGKSTLSKLLCGLYRPTQGTVRYGGNDPGEYGMAARFASLSAVFQSFVRYKMTLGDNVRVGEFCKDEPPEAALARAGFPLAKSGNDSAVMLSREFGGVDISGGEWQRIAIARGLYRDCDVIVLDEPTAAIDPLEESRLFALFRQISSGKTAVLVTHRLGSAKIADRIVVLDKGEIRECGSHDELLAANGLYALMYNEQAKWHAL